MKWVAISGSRQVNSEVESDVRREVAQILERGDGIVAGGAMGVDYIASDEVLKRGLARERLRICLPVPLDLYSAHYRKRSEEGVIKGEEAEMLVKQLEDVRNASVGCLLENKNTEVNQTTYFERHNTILDLSDEVLAFQVNGSPGTQDTIEKAEKRGLPVRRFTYKI